MDKQVLFVGVAIVSVLGMASFTLQDASAQVLAQDSLALVALYDSTDGANWTDNTNWLTGPVSTWYGITVSGDRVTEVGLRENNLVGTIPPSLGNLDSLQNLYLYGNQLSGSIPTELANLSALVILHLRGNQLSGNIPSVLGSLLNLETLSLGGNQLNGSIPSTLGNLLNLQSLSLRENQLSGSIPPELGNLSNLEDIFLSHNQLSGSIPSSLGNLSNLYGLYLYTNQLTGNIPSELGNLNSLIDLSLARNQLTGSIPPELGSLSNLMHLYLYQNQLSGTIPAEFGNLSQLEQLRLYNNQLNNMSDYSGSPMSASIQDIKVENNQLTFEDIEPNIGIAPTFTYSPQDSVGEEQHTTIDQGSRLELAITVGGTANQYQWMKDGVDISGADSSSYIIDSADSSHAGSYTCRITNTIATALTLYSRPINVTVLGEGECERGDVNCDGSITPGDALCTFWRAILGSFDAECLCECSEQASEINCDGSITPGDALCIFWRAILGDWTEECECLMAKGAAQSRSVFLVAVESVVGKPGEIIRVPIRVEHPQQVDAFGMQLIYPADLLAFQNVSATKTTADWIALDGVSVGSGVVNIGGFHTEGLSFNGSAPIVEVVFTLKDGENGQGELDLINLTDDLAGALVNKGSFVVTAVPATYTLSQNYPNPFNPTTTIHYTISGGEGLETRNPKLVTLKIYNLLGQEMRTLVDEAQESGYYTVTWDGRDDSGREVPSGVYFYHLEAADFTATKKMVLLK